MTKTPTSPKASGGFVYSAFAFECWVSSIRLMGWFQRMPKDHESAKCDECGVMVDAYDGVRDRARGKVWCGAKCEALGLERFSW